MALLRKLFYRKPPEGLLEISERVYAFDCCFTADILEDAEFKDYMGGIVGQLRDHLADASFMVFNFREGEKQSQIADILSEYDMTVMDYPRHYESCPVLTMEMIHHFLRSSESWLSLGQQNVILMHCERGGWPVLAFMLAALLIYRKQYMAEQKTLDMVYKQAPRELLQLMSPMNPMPSQLRYLQYVSRRNLSSEWPPLDRAVTLDCIILRIIPVMDVEGGCRPIFRIYGQDPFIVSDRTPKVLFSTPKRSRAVQHYKQANCELVKIDIHCHVIGDVVLECVTLDDDQEREVMMFRVMFNTAFIRSNILILNRDEIDLLWNVKDQFPKDFRAEVLFSEMNATTSLAAINLPGVEEKEGLPLEAFAKVHEIFSNVDWSDSKTDVALNVLQKMTESNILHTGSVLVKSANGDIKAEPNSKIIEDTRNLPAPSFEANSLRKRVTPPELQISLQRPAESKILSPRQFHTSLATSVLSSNSPQGSPGAISRYHSAPSTIGITALLHDHPVSPDTSATSSSCVIKSETNVLPNMPQSPLFPLPQHSMEATNAISETLLMSSPPPRPTNPATLSCELTTNSNTAHSSLSQHPEASINEEDQFASLSQTSAPQPSCLKVPVKKSFSNTPSPPPPNTSIGAQSNAKEPCLAPPPPSPLPPPLKRTAPVILPPPPPIPPLQTPPTSRSNVICSPAPPLPPRLHGGGPNSLASMNFSNAPVPPPPAPPAKGLPKAGCASPNSHSAGSSGNGPPLPGPPPPTNSLYGGKGRGVRLGSRNQGQTKKASLKPYHWLKLTRAMQGSLWAETQRLDEISKAPEFDMSELESLFSAGAPNSDHGTSGKSNRRSMGPKSDKVHLIELRRANNCEIMLSKVKIPLSDLM